MISSELVLIGAESVYSFLGGTDESCYDLRPNDLLKHEIIGWSRARGKRAFVLGGGFRPDDGIFRYKLAFAPKDGVRSFFVGRRIFDSAVYDALVRDRSLCDPDWSPLPGFFPAYRAPNFSSQSG
jgi:hypothetical protein